MKHYLYGRSFIVNDYSSMMKKRFAAAILVYKQIVLPFIDYLEIVIAGGPTTVCG